VNVLDLLVAARETLAAPGAWTQGEGARDQSGSVVGSKEPVAVCWCSIGAIHRGDDGGGFCGYDARLLVKEAAGGVSSLAEWNDAPGRTQAEVLNVFDRAIALAKERGL
jgi:hypothetical protein